MLLSRDVMIVAVVLVTAVTAVDAQVNMDKASNDPSNTSSALQLRLRPDQLPRRFKCRRPLP